MKHFAGVSGAEPLTLKTLHVIALLSLVACSKSNDAAPAPQASARPSATPPPASASAAPSAASSGKATAYAGTYALTPARIYIPETKDYGSVKQAKDDPSKHVGEGTVTIDVDASGRVTGTIDSGPASPGILDGNLLGDELRGTVRRKTPSDDGLTGTFAGKVAADAVEGKLSLAEGNAAVVREGKLSLKRK